MFHKSLLLAFFLVSAVPSDEHPTSSILQRPGPVDDTQDVYPSTSEAEQKQEHIRPLSGGSSLVGEFQEPMFDARSNDGNKAGRDFDQNSGELQSYFGKEDENYGTKRPEDNSNFPWYGEAAAKQEYSPSIYQNSGEAQGSSEGDDINRVPWYSNEAEQQKTQNVPAGKQSQSVVGQSDKSVFSSYGRGNDASSAGPDFVGNATESLSQGSSYMPGFSEVPYKHFSSSEYLNSDKMRDSSTADAVRDDFLFSSGEQQQMRSGSGDKTDDHQNGEFIGKHIANQDASSHDMADWMEHYKKLIQESLSEVDDSADGAGQGGDVRKSDGESFVANSGNVHTEVKGDFFAKDDYNGSTHSKDNENEGDDVNYNDGAGEDDHGRKKLKSYNDDADYDRDDNHEKTDDNDSDISKEKSNDDDDHNDHVASPEKFEDGNSDSGYDDRKDGNRYPNNRRNPDDDNKENHDHGNEDGNEELKENYDDIYVVEEDSYNGDNDFYDNSNVNVEEDDTDGERTQGLDDGAKRDFAVTEKKNNGDEDDENGYNNFKRDNVQDYHRGDNVEGGNIGNPQPSRDSSPCNPPQGTATGYVGSISVTSVANGFSTAERSVVQHHQDGKRCLRKKFKVCNAKCRRCRKRCCCRCRKCRDFRG